MSTYWLHAQLSDKWITFSTMLQMKWICATTFVLLQDLSNSIWHPWARSTASTSNMTEFIIIGPFQGTEVQRACFVLFLPIYLATLVSNGLTVLTVSVSECLCSPMYIFLGYLSLVEICYSSTVVPKFIADLLTEIKTISLQGCLAQIFFLHSFLVTESLC